ncbi:MAG: putative toxin-antitoxin system toxin component, PIN family [Bacteroidetes bacterium]|nr:putative toxin-antitoxin system toxin component, PIN family [Bacteroidota bacterium]
MIIVLDTNVLIAAFISPSEICRDKDDNNILETAVAAKANVIISGDKDLLVLKKYKNISIISPREFYNSEKGIS